MKNKFIIIICSIMVFGSLYGYGQHKNNTRIKTEDSKRSINSLNGEWLFFIDSSKTVNSVNWAQKGLPPILTRTVTVPHTWNVEEGLEKYWGKCWYEREIQVYKNQLSKTTRLQFDAVYHDAIIYINGTKVYEHLNSGYNRFFVDITPYIKEGKNKLTVCVDNSPSRSNLPFLKSFDWANDGGIYRNVYEIITENQAIRNICVDATPGGDKGFANIKVSFFDSAKMDKSKITLKAIITEENQSTQRQIFNGELKGKHSSGSIVSDLSFNKINPWHFDSPNLYKLNVKLFIDGIEKDEYSTVFGFRSIKIENNRYVLNGEPVRLIGVEWMPGSTLERGMAETKKDFENNLKLMKDANCIFTRFHWQQDEYILDWCDRNGIMIQEEIPAWGSGTILNDTLLKTGFQHLDEMINNHYNHPSIISWGIGNELESHNPINKSSCKALYNHAKTLDPSRLVSYVSNNIVSDFPSEGKVPDISYDFDIMMVNDYFSSWYGKTIDDVSGSLDRIAKEYPNKPMTISEWGLCEPVHKGGDARRSQEMARQFSIYGTKPYIAGAIYFCLNDYRTHMGEDFSYNYPQRVHGVCDINLKKKPSFTVLKTNSSPIEIKNIIQKEGKYYITISGKTGLPSYTVRNYTIVSENSNIPITELKPGEEITYEIKTKEKNIHILRSTGFEVLDVELYK